VGQSTLGQWCIDIVFVFTVEDAVNVVLIATLDGAESTGFVQHSVRTASDHKSSLVSQPVSLLLITASAEGLSPSTLSMPVLLPTPANLLPQGLFVSESIFELQGTGVDGLMGTPSRPVPGSIPATPSMGSWGGGTDGVGMYTSDNRSSSTELISGLTSCSDETLDGAELTLEVSGSGDLIVFSSHSSSDEELSPEVEDVLESAPDPESSSSASSICWSDVRHAFCTETAAAAA